MKIPATVGILTFNSERTLCKALESVKNFDEIIVCDGGSHDKTLDIAKTYNALIMHQERRYKNQDGSIRNFAGVRNQMLTQSKHDWFVFIDSDEYLSEECVREISIIIAKEDLKDPLAYWMPRKRVYKDKVIDCTTTYPNYQMRFFNKRGVTQFIKEVHERIELKVDTKVGYLANPEYVPFEYSKEEWKEKLKYYIAIEVERHKNQSILNWTKMVLNSMKVSTLYLLRHFYVLFFCRGHKMPWWYELMQHWYHWQLITRTGGKYFNSTTSGRRAG